MKITPIRARVDVDSWMYLIADDATHEGAVVDPYNAKLIASQAHSLGVGITMLLATHHHQDFSSGNLEFLIYSKVPCLGGSSRVPGLTHQVVDNVTLKVGENIRIRCIHTPCHAEGSICYYLQDLKTGERAVFPGPSSVSLIPGDDLSTEGNSAEVEASLRRSMSLPTDTSVYSTLGLIPSDSPIAPIACSLPSPLSILPDALLAGHRWETRPN